MELGNLRHYRTGKRVFIQINGNTIVGVTDQPVANQWVDCNNNLAIPGLIDIHVHGREDQPSKETAKTLELSALLGGVTLIGKMPNTATPATTAEIILQRAEQDRIFKIGTRFWLGATNDNLSEIIEVAKHLRHLVLGVKIYMGSSTGNLLVTDRGILRKILQTCAEYNLLVAVHAEDEALMRRNLERYGPNAENATIADHCVIRSTEVEVSAVRLALELQKETGCRLYFCHISTPESLELIQDAKNAGQTVYAEVCPHHIYLDSQFLAYGGEFKMNPPLRTAKQVDALARYVCKPGWVNVIATDHAPHKYPEEKIGQPYHKTTSGVPGLQTLLPLMFSFVREGKMSLDHFVNLTSTNAARICGLEGRGELEVGSQADIAIINDTEIRQFRDEDMATLWKWTPFRGFAACGFPSQVLVQGQLIVPDKLNV